MAGVNALVAKLERLAAHEVMEHITAKVRDACQEQCVAGFREQRDPYGKPWATRKPPKAWAVRAFGLMQDDGHPILDKSGDMINSLRSRASGSRVLMRILGYAKFHQYGTVRMEARMIFPDPARGLGLWRDPIEKASVEAVRELMR